MKQAADDDEVDGEELTFTRGLKLWSSWEADGDEAEHEVSECLGHLRTLRDVDIDTDVGRPNMGHGAGCEARLGDELPIDGPSPLVRNQRG